MYTMKTAELTKEQFDERDEIMSRFEIQTFGHWWGGIKRYMDLDVGTLEKLIEKGYADVDEKQNEAPCIGGFLELMKQYPTLKAHGYWVTRERDDSRISIEGVEGKCPSDIAMLFKHADDFEYKDGNLYVWYD